MKSSPNRLVRAWREEKGSAVLESTTVFPLVFISILLMMLLGLVVYQRVILYYNASSAADRAAFRWDNSHRDPATGLAPTGVYDGLYWRLTEDDMLNGIFGAVTGSDGGRIELELPASGETEGEEAGLQLKKMKQAAARLPVTISGTMGSDRQNLLRTIDMHLVSPLTVEAITRMTGSSTMEGKAVSTVADPVEFIRTVDLARYYAAKFGTGPAAAAKRQEAGEIVKQRRNP
ncbi:hypothetical protein [Paenibacillus tarimensis]|uniref:hypothetical protein n=1 Tax=Paenibacillus tarimensis TaxID=416012 RepID=UPI001F18B622|nr:hypothetical protein [Paenibacillus tarimensis]MCF2943543.1 hypothetical protein [Paenibacillus tarimensis]